MASSKAALGRAMSRLLKSNRIHIEKIGSVSRRRDKLTPGPAPIARPVNEPVQ